MKIGVVGSWADMLSIFKFLHKYDHDYVVYFDDLLWPYGDKPATLVQAVIADAVQVLRDRWCEQIILPPVRELAFRDQKNIMPLFQSYVMDYCFHHSLVGKIGLVGDWSDTQVAQPLFDTLAKSYSLTDNQKSTAKFQQPFARWVKEAQMRKYFLTTISYSDPLVNRVVKHDLRYFKDANVDTLIPLNYGYFNYQNTISKFCNYKKCRFHKLEKLEESFKKICHREEQSDVAIQDTSPGLLRHFIPRNDGYNITILYTGQKDLLERQKKFMRLLQRGKGVEVVWEKI
jgi:hypothetical protein